MNDLTSGTPVLAIIGILVMFVTEIALLIILAEFYLLYATVHYRNRRNVQRPQPQRPQPQFDYFVAHVQQYGYTREEIMEIYESLCEINARAYVRGTVKEICDGIIESALLQVYFLSGKHDLDINALLDCFRCFLLHGTFTYCDFTFTSDEMASMVVYYHRVFDKLYQVTSCDSMIDGILTYSTEYNDSDTGVKLCHYGKNGVSVTIPFINAQRVLVQHANAIIAVLEKVSKVNRAKSARN